jgi:hypothetical protein
MGLSLGTTACSATPTDSAAVAHEKFPAALETMKASALTNFHHLDSDRSGEDERKMMK